MMQRAEVWIITVHQTLLWSLVLSPVCAEARSLCAILSEAAAAGLSLDLSPELTRAVTNVICSLCFSSTYSRGDDEFESMLQYSQGIVDTVAKDSLVDVFPWLQVHTVGESSHRGTSLPNQTF